MIFNVVNWLWKSNLGTLWRSMWKSVNCERVFLLIFSKNLRLVEPRLQNFTTEINLFLLSIPSLLVCGLYFWGVSCWIFFKTSKPICKFFEKFNVEKFDFNAGILYFLSDLFVVVFVIKRLRESGIKCCVDSQTTFSLLFSLVIYCHIKTDYFKL